MKKHSDNIGNTKREINFYAHLVLFVFLLHSNIIYSQNQSCKGHSHNDYLQQVPFFNAYHNHMASIEADIWAIDGELFVAHEQNEISRAKTLDALYILPIVDIFTKNGGRAYPNSGECIQLLIELKSATDITLGLLIQKLTAYPEVFNPETNPFAIRIAITGNIPDKENFAAYPDFVMFDGEINEHYTGRQIKKLALVSTNFERFSNWKGVGPMPLNDKANIKKAIDEAHNKGLKTRFWNTPDNPETWSTLLNLGVDLINTDNPEMFNKYCPFNTQNKH